jgi:hypothetical protein
MYTGLHVNYPLFLLEFNQTSFLQIFDQSSNAEYHKNPSGKGRVIPLGQTDMTRLTVAFHDSVNEPKSY